VRARRRRRCCARRLRRRSRAAGGSLLRLLRPGRAENDYLRGRLDAAAELIALLIGKDPSEYRARCLRAFTAVLDVEKSALKTIPKTFAALRAEAAAG